VTGGHLIKHIFSSIVRGRGGCFGMLTFSHDTHVERQVSKDGNTHFTCFFLWYPHKKKKNPQKLVRVKLLVEFSAMGFTQIRPALNRRPVKDVASGFTEALLYTSQSSEARKETYRMCHTKHRLCICKEENLHLTLCATYEWLIYLIIKCKTRKEHKNWRPCNVHPFSNVYWPCLPRQGYCV
jgi:hypothetical protein